MALILHLLPKSLEGYARSRLESEVGHSRRTCKLFAHLPLDPTEGCTGCAMIKKQLTLGELSQVISLAERDPVVPENIVGRCHVKIEVGQREPGEIFLGSQTHNARRHFQLDLARIGVTESISLKFLDKL